MSSSRECKAIMETTLASVVNILYLTARFANGLLTFEKLTNQDYPSTTYFTTRNVSLYECQGWCRDDSNCVATSFSFVVNPLTPIQETSCFLHNETKAKKPSISPQLTVNTYYLTKINLRSENLCSRLWSFERIPNKYIRGFDNAIIFTSNKDACLSACLNEVRFNCRSVEFNYVTLECRISDVDRRSSYENIKLSDAQGVDYFENNCLQNDKICSRPTVYSYAKVGLPQATITHYVNLNYYLDKQILVSNRQECQQQCTQEKEFLCRSVLFITDPRPGKSVCKLYHVDHTMLPQGAETYIVSNPLPLLDSGESSGTYMERQCSNSSQTGHPILNIATGVVQQTTPAPLLSASEKKDPSCDAFGVCYDVSIQCTDTKIIVYVRTNRPFHGRIYALGRSETCHANILNSQQFRLDLTLSGQECNTQSLGGVYSNTVVLQHHNVVLTRADKVYNVRCTYEIASRNVSFGMLPIRDPDTLQITSSPEAPLPKIFILGADGREATTVRIGDKLTFRIEIPETTPYGIFARSCVAMAKDARSTFEVIDDRGCPVDPLIFPRFIQIGNALESSYEAFRFTESYGVIFQCNVKYCIGNCEPVRCDHSLEKTDSWGRKKRSSENELTLSHEILVLDFGDEFARSMKNTQHSTNDSFNVFESVEFLETCASKTSIMALSLTTALLLVVYICTVAYFVAHRRAHKEFS
ncbi:uncharacterized protein tyn [Centruroides vittatus]|uniref:uncharacterized protein tyn n=1 Tax=Centruroides vittatus TaxID=120091 RepID=UPI00350F4894